MLGLKRSSLPAIVRWRAQIWSVRTLAPSSPERIWILLVAGCLSIKHRLPVVRGGALPIRIRDVGTVWLADWSQLLVVWEIFQMDTYNEYPLPETAATILDLGANAGLASRYFRSGTRAPESSRSSRTRRPRVSLSGTCGPLTSR